MPPKRDGKRPGRGGRYKTQEEEPTETNVPATEKEIFLKEEYVNFACERVVCN